MDKELEDNVVRKNRTAKKYCLRKGIFGALLLSLLCVVMLWGNGVAAEYTKITIEPKDAGVFYQNKTQQFRAYGWTASNQKIEISKQVDWYIDPAGMPLPGQTTVPGQVATIDDTGLVTVHSSWGRVTVNACLPKGCGVSGGGGALNPGTAYLLRPSYTVTASASGDGEISPTGETLVKSSSRETYTLLADDNRYEVTLASVAGTCPKGALVGNYSQYRTGAITNDCTVELPFTTKPVVTPAVDTVDSFGTSTPESATPVHTGASLIFSLAPDDEGYEVSSVDTDCGAGTFSGPQNTTYTVGPVTKDCDVTFHFTEKPFYTVTGTVDATDGYGSISPETESIRKWEAATFTLTPDPADYVVSEVSGTCPAGVLTYNSGAGNWTYVTGSILADCEVIAHFVEETVTVNSSVSGGNGTVTPSGDNSFAKGGTAQFTLAPASGHIAGLLSDSCESGGAFTDNNTRYTTGVLTSDCAVVFQFVPVAPVQYTLTVNVSGPGRVEDQFDKIDCLNTTSGETETCTGDYSLGDTIQLTASDDIILPLLPPMSVFSSWAGCNTVAGRVCTVVIDGPTSTTATFTGTGL